MSAGHGMDVLGTIVATARRRVEDARVLVPMDDLARRVGALGPATGRFRGALSSGERWRVIAECKRRSPSRGVLRHTYDPVSIARAYELAGAAAISVLTEPAFFDGDLAHLAGVASAVSVPVLRKDFVVDEYQVLEARAAGAAAVLLIVAALDDGELRALLRAADDAGLDALVEAHDGDELRRALDAGATIVGVNNRNLKTLAVDVDTSASLAAMVPRDCVAVAESGLRTGADVRRLADAGYRAFLVGERFMTADHPGAALAAMIADAGQPPAEARP